MMIHPFCLQQSFVRFSFSNLIIKLVLPMIKYLFFMLSHAIIVWEEYREI